MLSAIVFLIATVVDDPMVVLAGDVVDAAGAPVAGAEVWLVRAPAMAGKVVVARGKSGPDGRFVLERPASLTGEGVWQGVWLWALAGDRVGNTSFAGAVPQGEERVRLVVSAGTGTRFLVEGPDGVPIAGARVRPQGLAPYYVALPLELARRLEATTNAVGEATIKAFSSEQLGHVDIEAPGFGVQPRYFDPPLRGLRRVTLGAAGSVAGRFVTEDGRGLEGWKVSAWTYPIDGSVNRGGGSAGTPVAVAADGSFRIGAIAEGSLSIRVDWPDGPDPECLPLWPQGLVVRAGEETRLEIPVRKAAEVTGVVRERGTGAPIAGVHVTLFRPNESSGEPMVTDADGRFQFRSLPGRARADLSDVPPTHVRVAQAYRDEIEVPAAPGRVELPPLELARAAPPLRGVVRGEDGAPVVGARVSSVWSSTEDHAHMTSSGLHISDGAGRFSVGGVASKAQVTLTARKGERVTSNAVQARAGQDVDVVLTIGAANTVVLTGRVVAGDGTPVAGAAVRFNARKREPNGTADWRQVTFEMSPWTYTGEDGTFRTPGDPRQEGSEYQAEAFGPGFLMAQSAWTALGKDDVLRLPDIVGRRELVTRALAGRVVDRAGAPIAGAHVLQRGDGPRPTDATSGAAGEFRLPGVVEGAALICAEAPGFRFGGVIARTNEAVEIRLTRNDEPVTVVERPRATMTRAEERALGLELLEPLLDRRRNSTMQQDSGTLLARLVPDSTAALLEGRVFSNPREVLVEVALARFEDDMAAALATLEDPRAGYARVQGLLAMADLAATIAPERRADLLQRALEIVRQSEQLPNKLYWYGVIADRWLESLDLEKAEPILREGLRELRENGRFLPAHEVAPFGEALAAIDQTASEALLARKSPGNAREVGELMRDRAAMAVRLAAKDAAAAEGIARELKEVPNFTEPETYLLRIARNMARADLARARSVVGLIDGVRPEYRRSPTTLPAYGLALIAEARARDDLASARALLDEAFEGLRRVADAAPGQPTFPPAASVMASLLPLVERVEPERLNERLWLAMACRPRSIESPDANQVAELLTLSLLISKFDRDMAAVIAGPAFDRFPELLTQDYLDARVVDLAVACDPVRVAGLLERLPEWARVARNQGTDSMLPSVDAQIRMEAARILGIPPAARAQTILGNPFSVWPVIGNGRYTRSFQ